MSDSTTDTPNAKLTSTPTPPAEAPVEGEPVDTLITITGIWIGASLTAGALWILGCKYARRGGTR